MECVPNELLESDQWVVWKYRPERNRIAKPPFQAVPLLDRDGLGWELRGADSSDPTTWTDFDTAMKALDLRRTECGLEGLGFAVGFNYILIDFDKVRDLETGELYQCAGEWVPRLDTWAEVSPSGTGVKLWGRVDPSKLRAILNVDKLPCVKKFDGWQVEVYSADSPRYGTITGQALDGCPTETRDITETMAEFFREVFAEEIAKRQKSATSVAPSQPDVMSQEKIAKLREEYRADTMTYQLGLWGLNVIKIKGSGEWTDYLLDCCPFEVEHGPKYKPKVSVHRDGGKSFSCFGGRCKDRKGGDGWRALREKFGGGDNLIPSAGAEVINSPGGGVVCVTNRQLRDITADVVRLVAAANDPPRWFKRGGVPVRLVEEEDERNNMILKAKEMKTAGSILNLLSETVTWTKVTSKGETVNTFPPEQVVTNLTNLPNWDLPRLRAIVETPVFTASGSLLTTPGYDSESWLWYHPGVGLGALVVPESPTISDVKAAVSLLVEDLLEGFPFVDRASRSNILGCLLLPFVRSLIEGVTPLHLVEAPESRTGKTLLLDCLCLIWTGRPAETTGECHSDEEWNKTLTSLLMTGAPYIFIDNINFALNSGTFSKILTDRSHKSRRLGGNAVVTLPVECVWIASANNMHASKELAGRVVKTRIDARMELPGLRPTNQFKHPALRRWVRENRAALVSACLTICRAWIRAKMPSGGGTLGGYEEYVQAIGGIQDVAEVTGFLENTTDNFETISTADAQWQAFVKHWHDLHGEKPATSAELFSLVDEHGLLLNILNSPSERGRQTQLGNALGNAEGRMFEGLRIERHRDADGKPARDRKGSGLYRLVKSVSASSTSPATIPMVGVVVGENTAPVDPELETVLKTRVQILSEAGERYLKTLPKAKVG